VNQETQAPVSETEESSHGKTKMSSKWLLYFLDSRRVVHKKFVPPSVSVNWECNIEVLDRLRQRVTQVRMETADDWITRAL
jgi:hypothetical protein